MVSRDFKRIAEYSRASEERRAQINSDIERETELEQTRETFPEIFEGGHTELYRHFGDDGALLYVGVSLSALVRLAQHRDSSHWFDEIARITIEKFPTRQAAEEAECAAISHEKPLHNLARPGQRVRRQHGLDEFVFWDDEVASARERVVEACRVFLGLLGKKVKRVVALKMAIDAINGRDAMNP